MVKLSRRKLAIYVADGLNRGEATTKLMKELAAYLIDSKRVGELELIVRDIEARLAADGTVVVTATSARPLSAVAKEALADLVKRDYGTKSSVVFRETVDAAVIGGVRLATPDKQWDGTIKTKLEKLTA